MKFNAFGIGFYFSYPALMLVTLSCLTAGAGQTIVLLCVLAALFHEVGHLAFICMLDGKPETIKVGIFEIKIIKNRLCLSASKELLIAFAGILFNLMFCMLAFVLYLAFDLIGFFDFAICNLVLAVVNMLPVKSFDGGQIAYLGLSALIGDRAADVTVMVLTVICMFPLAICGIYILFTSRHNYSLLFVFLYLLSILINKELR